MQQDYSKELEALIHKVGGNSIEALGGLSVDELQEQSGIELDAHDASHIFNQVQRACQQAVLERKKSQVRESPLLPKTLGADNETAQGIEPPGEVEDDEPVVLATPQLLGEGDGLTERHQQYSAPGDAASMFSPAAYLTALYRNARALYPDGNPWHIDKRRPDLANLVLNQQNLDTPVSALSLSNEILLAQARTALVMPGSAPLSDDQLLERLSTDVGTSGTPYHQHHNRLRQVFIQKDPGLQQLSATPALARHLDEASMACLHYAIAPAMRALLTDEITEANAEEKFSRYFPGVTPEAMMQPARLRSWFGLADADLETLMGAVDKGEYQKQSLTTRVGHEIARVQMSASSHFINYVRLFPLPANQWQVAFNLKVSRVANFRLGGAINLVLKAADFGVDELMPNVEYRWTVDLERAPGNFTLSTQWTKSAGGGGGGHAHQFNVNYERLSAAAYLLQLNKLVRLYQTVGISPLAFLDVMQAIAPATITDQTLATLYRVDRLVERYSIAHAEALVMARGMIQEAASAGEQSQFDSLFNAPPLVEGGLNCNGVRVSLHPEFASDQTDIKATLKRACRTDDQGLYELGLLMSKAEPERIGIDLNLSQLSGLYTLSLWARHHGLTPRELRELLQLLGAPRGLWDAKLDVWLQLLAGLRELTGWLAARGWTVHDLQLITRDVRDIPVSAEISNLLGAMKSAWADAQPADTNPVALPNDVLAPLVASTFNLRGEVSAQALLRWADQAKPGGLSLQQACQRLLEEQPSGKPERALVDFAYGLAQMALVVHGCAVTDDALAVWVDKPHLLYAGAGDKGALPRDPRTFMALGGFADWYARLADPAGTGGSLLQALSAGKGVTLAQLAKAAGVDQATLAEAAAGAHRRKDIQSATTVSTWQEIERLLQCMALARTYGVMPGAIDRLLGLKNEWSDWQQVADMFQAGLAPAQARQAHAATEQPLSAALVGVLGARQNLTVEALNQHLLLDALNAERVMTSRIGEAMAALQQFIHLSLTTPEDRDALMLAVLKRPFFSDWTHWNATYANWAAGQMLMHFPENYIDPTVRHGQTEAMNDMLQALGQAQINADTVGDAFQGYLTAFEEVANLETISGYHDSRDASLGKSWFVGRSRGQLQQYWWRDLDEAKRSPDGALPANAWSAWRKIELAPQVLGRLIRPVVYRGRLHLGWVEREERIIKRNDNGQPDVREWYWSFKLAWRRYDGNWTTPLDFPLSVASTSNLRVENLSLFLSAWPERDGLMLAIYDRAQANVSAGSVVAGLQILENLTSSPLATATYLRTVQHWLDTPDKVGMCAVFDGAGVPIAENRLMPVSGSGVPERFRQFHAVLDEAKVTQVTSGPAGTYSLSIRSRLTVSPKRPPIANEWVAALIGKYPALGREAQALPALLRSGHGAFLVRKEGNTYWGYLCLSRERMNAHFYGYDLNAVRVADDGPTLHYESFTESATASGAAFFGRYKIGTGTYPLQHMNVAFSLRYGLGHIVIPMVRKMSVAEALAHPGSLGAERIVPGDYLSPPGRVAASDIFCRLYGANQEVVEVVRARHGIDFSTGLIEAQLPFNFEVPAGKMAHWGKDSNEALHRIEFQFGRGVSRSYTLKVYKDADTLRTAIIGTTDSNAQYLAHRSQITRLNTLFARELTVKAVSGIDEILKYDSQQMPEPRLDVLVRLILPVYDAAHHGSGRAFKVWLARSATARDLLCSGTLSDSGKTTADMMFAPGLVYAGQMAYHLEIEYSNKRNSAPDGLSVMIDRNTLAIMRDSQVSAGSGNKLSAHIVDSVRAFGKNDTRQMDFSGANALYFWELFYYSPMMVMQRFLQEERFEQAEQWLKYVYNPSGYGLAGANARKVWNVRPLLEDTSWNDEPLKSLDPDAVAQNDPMHYKLNAFMRLLDICMGRGDAAYRKLERDTLSEAKVWYLRAQRLLGDAPWTPAARGWNAPRLGQAAVADAAPFLPEVNRTLLGYWDALRLRLYNLRHNLTLDGQLLNLPLYATPADPKALLAAAVAAEAGGELALAEIREVPALRFTTLLEGARAMAAQLIQFGSNMQGVLERLDADALANLLTTQGAELADSNVALFKQTLKELAAEQQTLECSLASITLTRDHYLGLYEGNVSEREDLSLRLKTSSGVAAAAEAGFMSGAAVVAAFPKIFGFSNGGGKPEDALKAVAYGFGTVSKSLDIASSRISQEEAYRRRRNDWKFQYESAQKQMATIQAQLDALSVRETSAQMHLAHLQTQSAHAKAQLALHQGKFTGKALYSWMRARLASIFYTYYDLTVSRCLMAQKALQWEKGDNLTYLRTGTWNGAWAGLLCGEGLMLALGQMDTAWVKWQKREMEVTRTVSLARLVDGKLSVAGKPLSLGDAVKALLAGKAVEVDAALANTRLSLAAGNQLSIQFGLQDLNLALGFENAASRRVRSIAVSLPALLGPYQDVHARLLTNATGLPAGCDQVSISSALQDSGLFSQLNGYPLLRQGAQLLPFEGMKIPKAADRDQTHLTLNFDRATGNQRGLLESLSDIILHVQFTVR